MKMVSKPPHCSSVVVLLDWFLYFNKYILVMEQPCTYMDGWEFVMNQQDQRLSETQTRDILMQVTQAARHCCERRVLHRDIKAENLLINPINLQVKLIDFGCGTLLKDTPYDEYAGNFME